MHGRSPAQLYVLLLGVVLTAAGILGFFYNADFSHGANASRDAVLGILDVNAWLNIVHLATGLLGLTVMGSYAASRRYALAFGVAYIIVGVLGLIVGDGGEILSIIPINTADTILHFLLGIAGIGAGMATAASPGPTTARAPAA